MSLPDEIEARRSQVAGMEREATNAELKATTDKHGGLRETPEELEKTTNGLDFWFYINTLRTQCGECLLVDGEAT